MNKALALLQQTPKSENKKSKTPSVSVETQERVRLGTYDRETTVAAAARLYRLLKRKMSAIETEMDVIKDSLRTIGCRSLELEALEGRYVSRAVVGCVEVTRANKFYPVPYDRDALMDAIGATEYRVMFNETAVIQFESIDRMREFVTMCKEAGVDIGGEVKETVVGNAKLVEHIVKTKGHLDPAVVELLKACAKDQALRVSVK